MKKSIKLIIFTTSGVKHFSCDCLQEAQNIVDEHKQFNTYKTFRVWERC